MNIAVTGGTGYIGSHTIIELVGQGHQITIIDNLSNSSPEVIEQIRAITGKLPLFVKGDILNTEALASLLKERQIDAVLHFAALKAVGESVRNPLLYYRNNVSGSLSLLEAMQSAGVQKIIFSSSACVYGKQPIPYTEKTARSPENPYGRTKYMIELMLEDWAAANPKLTAICLRYFNPIGAHPSGLIGEDPAGVPNNLMPYIAEVASGKRNILHIFGNDYNTSDGTAKRDYIHVVDVAKGHLAALESAATPGFHTYNLGSGQSTSVLEMIRAFEHATGVTIPYEFAPRRTGDLPEFYADASKARQELGWRTTLSIEQACADTWRWQQNHRTKD